MKRKWAPKNDIILLTKDAAYFKKKVEEFSSIEEKHIKKIEAVEKQLNQEVQDFAKNMRSTFDDFEEEKLKNRHLPCLLTEYAS